MSLSFLFPGQGSQYVGMGQALADQFLVARSVFEEVDEALGEPLSHLIFEGSEADLTQTANTQPALMAVSLAAFRVFEAEFGREWTQYIRFFVGHSLGEYSALAAAGALSLEDTARLLRLRGEAMQRAVPVGMGSMAAIIGMEKEALDLLLQNIAAQTQEVCQIANDNGGGQIVISGARIAVEQAITAAKEAGAKRALVLPVSAPFHCALMQPAAEKMHEALGKVTFHPPRVPIVSNVLACPLTDPIQIRERLVEQVTGSVRFRESILFLEKQGITDFYEIGAGRVLSGLLKRIIPHARVQAVGDPEGVKALTTFLKEISHV